MELQLLDYTSYKIYLKSWIENSAQARGMRLKMSEYIGCQSSYLSQVLNGKPDLTLEQASRLNQFLLHNPTESKYFVLLVELARAGTLDLRDLFLRQIKEMQETKFHFKKRLKQTEEIPENARHRYYSVWFYSAIHVALSIPGHQSTAEIAALFNLPPPLVAEVIDFLEEIGLIENKKGTYHLTKRRIHLERESIFIQRHHINWRSQALQSAEKNLADDLHYSNVIAISQKDSKRVKEIMMNAVENARKVIGPSKEEKVYAMTLDFFQL